MSPTYLRALAQNPFFSLPFYVYRREVFPRQNKIWRSRAVRDVFNHFPGKTSLEPPRLSQFTAAQTKPPIRNLPRGRHQARDL